MCTCGPPCCSARSARSPARRSGILLSWALTSYFASSLFAISAPFSVDLPVLIASIAVGVIGPPLAALPAISRAARLPLAQTLQATGSATGPQGRLDRLLRRARFLPRTAQIGLRGVTRRRRRSIATAVQVGLAVATLLAFLSFATSVSNTVNQSWNSYRYNISRGIDAERGAPAQRRSADRLRSRGRPRPAAAAQQRQGRRPGRPACGPCRTSRCTASTSSQADS